MMLTMYEGPKVYLWPLYEREALMEYIRCNGPKKGRRLILMTARMTSKMEADISPAVW